MSRWSPIQIMVSLVLAPMVAAAAPPGGTLPADSAFLAAAGDNCEGCKVLNKTRACYPYLGHCSFHAKVYKPGAYAGVEVVLDDKLAKAPYTSGLLAKLEAQQRYLTNGPISEDLWLLVNAAPDAQKIPIVVWLRAVEAAPIRETLIADPDLMAVHVAESEAMLAALHADFAKAVAERLAIEGQPYKNAPAVLLEATRSDILWLSSLETVAMIYAWEEGVPMSSSWYYTNNADCTDCNSATNIPVCIIDKYRPDDVSTLSIIDYYIDPPNGYTDSHTRFMVGLYRSTSTVGGGMASASSDYMGDLWDGTNWYLGPTMGWCASMNARAWSYSRSTNAAEDRLFDYWVTHSPYPLIAGATGNGYDDTTVYNTGFNVMCSGGSDDKGTSSRSDDTHWNDGAPAQSIFKNPSSPHNDRELPVIVAPSKAVTAAGITSTGTSASAPQVAAAAAQLQYRNSALANWPEAQRAILMVGADENVDGPVLDLGDQVDDKDGAGALNLAISASLAGSQYKVNGGNNPAIMGHDYGTMVFASDFTNNYYNEVYYARTSLSNLRLRVVLAWDSTASCSSSTDPSSCTSDTLDADLDLHVFVNGELAGSSASYDNSYEFVEIRMQADTTYTIKVYKASQNQTQTYFGLAWYTWTYGT